MKEIVLNVEKSNNVRLDVYISIATDITRSYAKKLCDIDNVFINGSTAKSKKTVKDGDVILIKLPEESLNVQAKDIPIDIVYQDDDVAVINKPQGLTVHAGNGTGDNTLVNALLYHLDKLSAINGVVRPGIVHRIDKNTSGLLVVAKNDKAHLSLAKQLEDKTCSRIYFALVEGVIKQDSGVIDTFIGRNVNDRTKMSVVKVGRRAITDYKVLQRYEGYTFCEFALHTGRTHQIRVHAKHIGHPIVGDKEYGFKNQKFKLEGQLLHAGRLGFVHPISGKEMIFEAPLPEYFTNILGKLKKKD